MPNLLERHWQKPKWYLTYCLKPLSWLFARIVSHRRQRCLAAPAPPLAVPVVVVGNIHVGGVGKTPLVAALTQDLQALGLQVGLISRGYGRDNKDVTPVLAHSLAQDVGDEPLLLVNKTQAPMMVAARRMEAAQALLQDAALDLIIADDGLQHYALPRQLELLVYPADDLNQALDVLPNGPLREPLSRLQTVDAVIVSRMAAYQAEAEVRRQLDLPKHVALFQAQIQEGTVYGWNTEQAFNPYHKQHLLAVCAIGRPQQFMLSLAKLGIHAAEQLCLPDHASIDWNQIPSHITAIITTEKDAVKWANDAPLPVWVLPIDATIVPNLAHWVAKKLQLTPKQD